MTYLLTHLAIGLFGGYAILTFAEWWLHAYNLHRPGPFNRVLGHLFENHQKVHHPAYRHDFTHADPEEDAGVGVVIDTWGTMKLLVPMLLLAGLVLPVEALVFYGMVLLHHAIWNAVHAEMHAPQGAWFTRCALFSPGYRLLERYHRTHHEHPRSNYNVVALGADFMARTYRAPAKGESHA